MAIVLITGVPGTGKSLLATTLVIKDKRFKDRELFHNIDGLRVGKFMSGDELKEWAEPGVLPDGALVAWDEVQFQMPQRTAGKEVPKHVEQLAIHRKRGIDFLFMTQSPNSFDSFAKDRVTEHHHLIRPWGLPYAKQWTAQGETFDPKKRNAAGILRSRFKYEKWVFHLYKSAEQHTDVSKKPLAQMMMIAAALAVLVYCLWGVFHPSAPPGTQQIAEAAAKSAGAKDTKPATSSAANPFGGGVKVPTVDRASWGRYWTTDRQALVIGEPASAPVYAQAYKVVAVPVIAGCSSIAMGGHTSCTCNDQQGNRMPSIGDYECQRWIKDGVFDPTSGRDYRLEADAWISGHSGQSGGLGEAAGSRQVSTPAPAITDATVKG